MTLDLYNFTSDKANVPIDVVFVHPVTGKPTDVVFHVVGLDSTAAQKCLDEQQAVRFTEMTSGNELATPKFDPQESRMQLIELLVACTVGWTNLMFKGEVLEFTKENATMIYDKVPAIRDQVNKATGSRKLFFKD